MKRIIKKSMALCLIVIMMISMLPVMQTKAATTTGEGTKEDPLIVSVDTFGAGEEDYLIGEESDGYAYITLKFAEAGKLSLDNEGSYNMYVNGATSPVIWIRDELCQAGTQMTLKIRGNKLTAGTIKWTYTSIVDQTTGESLDDFGTKEKAKDITAGYNAMDSTFQETKNDVWYKFTIDKSMKFELRVKTSSSYVSLCNEAGQSILNKDTDEDKDMIMFFRLDRFDGSEDGVLKGTASYPGTYYLHIQNSLGYDGKINMSFTDYIPINSINFTKGKDITVEFQDEYKTGSFENKIISYNPANTDGKVVSTVHDSNFSSVGKWDPINTFNVKKYGRTTIGYLDERGVKVDEVKVTIVPQTVDSVQCVGTYNKIVIYPSAQSLTGNGDCMRLYTKKGKKWKLSGTMKKSAIESAKGRITIKKLKQNKNYQFRLSNYDSASGMESKLSKVFTAGTALKKVPKIKSVKKKKIIKSRDAMVHNPGKITERYEYYDVFTCQAKIGVTKIKGATSYYFSCGYEIKKEKGTVVLAKTTGSVKKFPKKIKLKVFAKRKINSYSVAYGEVSKAKTVKIR